MYSPRNRLKGAFVAFCATVAAVCILAASAQAANVYPVAGGSTFTGNEEGWKTKEASCTFLGLPLLGSVLEPLACDAAGGYDGAVGNQPGSLKAETAPGLDLLGLVSKLLDSKVVLQSPQFTVANSGLATLSLERQFDPGGVVNLKPEGKYTVSLEAGDGTVVPVATESLGEETALGAVRFSGVPVTAGHSYVIQIESKVSSGASIAAPILLPEPAKLNFDNVALAVPSAGEPGGPGEPGSPGDNGNPGGNGNPGSNGNNPGGNGDNSNPGSNGTNAQVSAGVRIVRGPLPAGAIARLARSVKLGADVGHGRGGSLIPLSECTIIGTAHRDVITGTGGNDVICGLGGNDVIRGARGRDVIDGGNGDDVLAGGTGADVLIGLRGRDTERGGPGNDRLGGGAQGDRLLGGSGNDLLIGRRGANRLYGGPGNDRLIARNHRRDVVRGGSGHDVAHITRVDRKSVRGARIRMH